MVHALITWFRRWLVIHRHPRLINRVLLGECRLPDDMFAALQDPDNRPKHPWYVPKANDGTIDHGGW